MNNYFHGSDGPLKVSDLHHVVKGTDLFLKTIQELGIPYNNDFNDGNQYGVGLMQHTIDYSRRCSAVDAFINPIRKNKTQAKRKFTKFSEPGGLLIVQHPWWAHPFFIYWGTCYIYK